MKNKSQMWRSSLVAAFLLGIPALLPRAVHASPAYLYFWENHHQLEQVFHLTPQLSYYRSTSQYNTNAAKIIPTGFLGYSRIQGDVIGEYGLTSKFTLFGRFSWSKLETETTLTTQGRYGMGDQALGFNYRVWQSGSDVKNWREGMAIDLQAQVDLPAYPAESVSLIPTTPILGDHSTDLSLGAFASLPFSQNPDGIWSAQVGGSFMKRTLNYSTAYPWSALVRYRPRGAGISAEGGFFGRTTTVAQPAATAVIYNDYGGSLGGGSKTPSIMNLRGRLGYILNPNTEIFAGLTQSMWGQATPAGTTFTVGLSIDLGKTKEQGFAREEGESFTPYSNFEAKIIKTNDRMNLYKIDKGSKEGVEVGQVFDVFKLGKSGNDRDRVARARVTSVRDDEAVITISDYYKEVWIEEGFKVRKPIK